MRKFLLVGALLMGGAFCAIPSVYAVQVTKSARDLPDDAKPITVYYIKQVGGNAWSSNPKSAYYSASENCIYVDESHRKNQPYTVTKNPAYGQDRDGRGSYKYYAGGYYFNL